MSATAIKDVTRALQVLLLSQLTSVSSSAQVSLLPPGDKLPSGLGVNLYLFRIMESAYLRNLDWPGDRNMPGTPAPALGLELSYLLTPYAPPPDLSTANGDDGHIMLGTAMLVLYQNPILNRVHIPGFDADSVLPASILDSYEQVKVTLATTSLEELSKIWATINQPYRLSVAYHVSLVQLTPSDSPPVSGSQVLSIGLDAVAWNAPRVESLSPTTQALTTVNAAGALVPSTLTIFGSSLVLPGQNPAIQVGGAAAVINSSPTPNANAVSVTLPVDVSGGPQAMVSVSLNGRSGATSALTITPWLSRITPIRSGLESTVLQLTGIGFAGAQSVRFEGPGGSTTVSSFVGAPTDTQATVNIPASLPNGLFAVRMVLASASASNSATLEIIPSIISPIAVAPVAVAGSQVSRLTVSGSRLNGSDVKLILDGVAYSAGANANATQAVFTLGRLLNSGTYSAAVSVNGSLSHTLPQVIA